MKDVELEYTDNQHSNNIPKIPSKKSKSKKDYSHLSKKDDRGNGRDDRLILYGIVEEALPGTWFKIKLASGDVNILATLSGKMRQNHIQILPGDNVIVEVSPYDTSRGRITRRK